MSLASVRPSVRPYVSCLENRMEYFKDTSQLFRTGHDDVSLQYFFSYLPLMLFYAYSCPLCNLNTVWNIIMILHSYVEHVMTMCRVQE